MMMGESTGDSAWLGQFAGSDDAVGLSVTEASFFGYGLGLWQRGLARASQSAAVTSTSA